jgi:hypothetical protein
MPALRADAFDLRAVADVAAPIERLLRGWLRRWKSENRIGSCRCQPRNAWDAAIKLRRVPGSQLAPANDVALRAGPLATALAEVWRGMGLVNVAERNKARVSTLYYAITPQSRFKLLCYRALEEGGLPCGSFLRSCASSPARVLP